MLQAFSFELYTFTILYSCIAKRGGNIDRDDNTNSGGNIGWPTLIYWGVGEQFAALLPKSKNHLEWLKRDSFLFMTKCNYKRES